MDAMLSTSEVAELTGISLRHVKRLAASNKLPCEKTVNSNNRPKYLFPLSGLAALDPTLPQRYLAQHAQEGTAEGAAEPQNAKRGRGRPRKGGAGKTAASKPLEEYSTEERGEIAFWTQAVQDWRGYRAGYRDKAAADEAWLAQFRLDHPEVHITRKILYARQRAVLEDDLDGLVDGRGKARRGYCKIPAAAWDAFMYYYLDQRQSPIKQCYDQTIYFLEQHCPGKPFLGDAVRRAAEGKIKHDIKGEQKNRDDKNQPRVGAGFSESFHPILLPTFLFLWISSTARKPQ